MTVKLNLKEKTFEFEGESDVNLLNETLVQFRPSEWKENHFFNKTQPARGLLGTLEEQSKLYEAFFSTVPELITPPPRLFSPVFDMDIKQLTTLDNTEYEFQYNGEKVKSKHVKMNRHGDYVIKKKHRKKYK